MNNLLVSEFLKTKKSWQDPKLFSKLESIEFNLKAFESEPIYPAIQDIFKAFKFFEKKETKVLILGQDPYYTKETAMGLSFSVQEDKKIPKSLQVIFKEIGIKPKSGDLSAWAEQGVLLLNTILSVSENKPASHKNVGWLEFTKTILESLPEDVICCLWGNFAKTYESILGPRICLKSSHPAPPVGYVSFLGCGHFSQINEILISKKKTPIEWNPDLFSRKTPERSLDH